MVRVMLGMTNKLDYKDKSRRIPFRMFLVATFLLTIPVIMTVLTYAPIKVEAQNPDIDASNVYDTKSMSLGNNVKNLVVLIPNEAHESQNIGDQSFNQRHINQPYIPQSVTVPKGTSIIWFNGDVDHDHKITLTGQGSNSNNMVFDSDTFAYNTASQPVVMNDAGTFGYHQADVNNEDLEYVMNGTINVVDQPNPSITSTTTGNITDIDTVGTLMVPTDDLATYTSDLEGMGFSVLSTHNFDDIRSDDQQTLILWGASSTGTNSIENIASHLSEITPTLPYS
jgi:plastocyanin